VNASLVLTVNLHWPVNDSHQEMTTHTAQIALASSLPRNATLASSQLQVRENLKLVYDSGSSDP